MPQVTFMPEGKTVEVAEGETILDAALINEIDVNHNCGGNCVCSTCHVVVEKGSEQLDPRSEEEDEMLEEVEDLHAGSRLSCQTVIIDDLVVRIPPSESL